MPDTGLGAKGAALNTACTAPVLKGFLSRGRRVSVMSFLQSRRWSYLWRIYGRNRAYFRSQEKSASF